MSAAYYQNARELFRSRICSDPEQHGVISLEFVDGGAYLSAECWQDGQVVDGWYDAAAFLASLSPEKDSLFFESEGAAVNAVEKWMLHWGDVNPGCAQSHPAGE